MADSGMSDSPSGLTATEAQEFHRLFMGATFGSFAASFVAHVLVWLWRPLASAGAAVPPDWRFF